MTEMKCELLQRAERVLSLAFKGMHNVPGKVKMPAPDLVEVSVFAWGVGLSTWDRDELTRLVVGAHGECLRLAVVASGPRMVKLRFSARVPLRAAGEAPIAEGHPTIHEAVSRLDPVTHFDVVGNGA